VSRRSDLHGAKSIHGAVTPSIPDGNNSLCPQLRRTGYRAPPDVACSSHTIMPRWAVVTGQPALSLRSLPLRVWQTTMYCLAVHACPRKQWRASTSEMMIKRRRSSEALHVMASSVLASLVSPLEARQLSCMVLTHADWSMVAVVASRASIVLRLECSSLHFVLGVAGVLGAGDSLRPGETPSASGASPSFTSRADQTWRVAAALRKAVAQLHDAESCDCLTMITSGSRHETALRK